MTTKQKTLIVTGASQGIGAAIANLALDRGYNVVGNSRKISDKNELQRSDKLALVDGDIGLASTAELIVATALKRFGSVDALVNNAGVAVGGPVEEVSAADWKRQFDINFFGWIEVIRAALPLLRQGVRTQGINMPRLVLVSSIGGRVAQPFLAPYTCSKAAATALGDSLRLELRRQGIGVSVIEPGAEGRPPHRRGRLFQAASA